MGSRVLVVLPARRRMPVVLLDAFTGHFMRPKTWVASDVHALHGSAEVVDCREGVKRSLAWVNVEVGG